MRLAVALAFVTALFATVATGCPSSQDPGGGNDVTPDGGVDEPDAATCDPVATCDTTFRYAGTGTTVEVRGDFAPDGWTVGVPMTRGADGVFTATVPAADQQVIVYKLVVDGNWIADPANTRRSPDGFGASNSVVRVDCDHCPLARKPFDWHDAIMYFVLIDRFANGSTANDAPVNDVEVPGQYQGGDFLGLTDKIEEGYFDDLGINTLWITSPIDNSDRANPGSDGHSYSGYHGYWPADLTKAESKYGTEAELKAMVDAAHAHGINVLVDYVMNHVHSDSPVYAAHRDWFWPNDNGRGGNCVCGGGCSWDTDRTRCWFDNFLPDFNFQNADARRWSVDNAVQWAKRIGIDGFRLDAVKHIETSWLTDLRARIDAEVAFDQPFYMVGETFDGSRDLIKSYVDPHTMLDGQFDFPLRGTVLSTVLRRDGSMADLGGFLATNVGFYGPGSVMSTFLGNHDVPRAIHLAEDSPQFGAWDGGKDRAWTNRPSLPQSAHPFERLAVAYTLMFTLPGIPMIYYGDEWGMPGAGDPDNRRFMQWSNYNANQQALRDRIAALADLRKRHPALRVGTWAQLAVSQDTLTYELTDPGSAEKAIVILNRGDSEQQVTSLPDGVVDAFTLAAVHGPVTVPARSAGIWIQSPGG